MPQVTLDGSNLLITLAVILIVLEALSVITKGVDAWKKLTGRDDRAREMTNIKERLSSVESWKNTVEHRFEQRDMQIKETQADTLESLKALHRIIKHLQSGNDHQKLNETDEKLFDYLVKRGVSPKTLE